MAMQVDQTPALLNLAGASSDDMQSSEDERLPLTATLLVEWKDNAEAGKGLPSARDEDTPEKAGAVSRSTRRPSWVPGWKQKSYENTWLFGRLASDDSNARINANPEKTRDHGLSLKESAKRTWNPRFDGNKLHIRGHFVGYLPTRHRNPETFTMRAMSDGNTYDLCWVTGESIKEGEDHTIERKGTPYHGTTAREADVVCAFEGIRTLFLVRMMFKFSWSVHGP